MRRKKKVIMEYEGYSPLDREPLPEVGKTRLTEYKAIKKKVDAKAERLTRKELNMRSGVGCRTD